MTRRCALSRTSVPVSATTKQGRVQTHIHSPKLQQRSSHAHARVYYKYNKPLKLLCLYNSVTSCNEPFVFMIGLWSCVVQPLLVRCSTAIYIHAVAELHVPATGQTEYY